MYDGMHKMTHRTTFALDEATAVRLKRLSAQLNVSQAEVVRRAVAEIESMINAQGKDPMALLREVHASGQGLAREAAESYLAEVREDRKKWRGE